MPKATVFLILLIFGIAWRTEQFFGHKLITFSLGLIFRAVYYKNRRVQKKLMPFLFPAILFGLSSVGRCENPHWAFRPLLDMPPSAMKNEEWVKNEIDRFILKGLRKVGLQPPPIAESQVLQRRLHYALIGLPPMQTHEIIPFKEVLENLLSSKHYGEKWARHWMDVVRYSDSNGLDENLAFAHAWRFRDYIIDAFNRDLPFDRFAIEQIAGDQLIEGKNLEEANRLKIATGFLALGPKLLAEPDPIKMEMDMIDEQIDVLGQVFLGMTIGCARCHDHMSDPITMAEYYSMAGIFKSTLTMESVSRPTRWFEHVLSSPSEQEHAKRHDLLIEAQKKVIEAYKEKANLQLLASGKVRKVPKNPSVHYSDRVKQELKNLDKTLKRYEEERPKLNYCHGVTDGNATNLKIFIRGDPDTLGNEQKRGFPAFFETADGLYVQDSNRSGRLELARWITENCKPLFARVIVNRIWHWHFGRGLVKTPDNFGTLGGKPSHPELLDWLACRMIEDNWSIKNLHRRILSSATWQSSSKVCQNANKLDPENNLYSRFPVRRMEVEAIRDTWLCFTGDLNRSIGGKIFFPENRKHIFTVSSIDETNYDMNRRSLYLPVIRNHIYDFFNIFDFPDPKIVQGDRKPLSTTQQALFLLNSPKIAKVSRKIAEEVWDSKREDSVRRLYLKLYHREARNDEVQDSLSFLREFPNPLDDLQPFVSLTQAMLSSNEFLYIR